MFGRKCWRKAVLAVALCLSMITGILSGMGELRKAKADPEEGQQSYLEESWGFHIWIGGVVFSSPNRAYPDGNMEIDSADNTENKKFDGTAKLVVDDTGATTKYTLTLDSFMNNGAGEVFAREDLATIRVLSNYHNDGITGAAIICDCDGDLEIVLKGESKITAEKYECGLFCSENVKSVTISTAEDCENASLQVSGGHSEFNKTAKPIACGIFADCPLVMKSGTVEANALSAEEVKTDSVSYTTYGVNCKKDITIFGGSLTGTAYKTLSKDYAVCNYGVRCGGSISAREGSGKLTGVGNDTSVPTIGDDTDPDEKAAILTRARTSDSYGVYCRGTITMKSGEIKGTGGESVGESFGVSIMNEEGEDIIIGGTGKLTACGGTTGQNGSSYGLRIRKYSGKEENNSVIVKESGMIDGKGGISEFDSFGIRVTKTDLCIEVNALGGVSGEGGRADQFSRGIDWEGLITVNGGKLIGQGGSGTNDQSQNLGIHIYGDLQLNGGIVTAKAYGVEAADSLNPELVGYGTYGLECFGDISINGGVFNAVAYSGEKYRGSAVSGDVLNSIVGRGWQNSAGTGDPAMIGVSETGRELIDETGRPWPKVVFHGHAYECEGKDDTITVSCTLPECDLDPESAELVIKAPERTNAADGETSNKAALENLDKFKAYMKATGLMDDEALESLNADAITYYLVETIDGKEVETALNEAPIDPGCYKAKITVRYFEGDEVKEATAEVAYELTGEKYPLWIGYKQFTDGNPVIDAEDYPNEDSFQGKAEYDPESNTLTLSDLSIDDISYGGMIEDEDLFVTAAIFYEGTKPLTIVYKGNNEIRGSRGEIGAYGFCSAKKDVAVTWKGDADATLTMIAGEETEELVVEEGEALINSSDEYEVAYDAIYTPGDIVFQSGTISVIGMTYGIQAANTYVQGGNVTIIGGKAAVDGKLQNDIAGSGWTDTDGKNGETYIEATESPAVPKSADGSIFRKMVFPTTHEHSYGFTLADDGTTIVAGCKEDGCLIPAKSATLTLVKPKKTAENDTSSPAASIDNLEEFNALTGLQLSDKDIEYYSGTKKLDGAPSEAGTYTAKLTIGTGENAVTASIGYTIKAVKTVIWLNGDGSELDRKMYVEGEKEPTTDKTPTKADDENNTYTFKNTWTAKENGKTITYTPDFEAKKIEYTYIWKDRDGTELGRKTVKKGEEPTTPDKDPDMKQPTKNYKEGGDTFEFVGWKKVSEGDDGKNWTFEPVYEKVTYTTNPEKLETDENGAPGAMKVHRSPDDDSCYDHFVCVKSKSGEMDKSLYESGEGCTEIKLKKEAIESLGIGTHRITVVFDDGEVSFELVVKEAAKEAEEPEPAKEPEPTKEPETTPEPAPEPAKEEKEPSANTGDTGNLWIWAILAMMSAGAAGGVYATRRMCGAR